MDYLAKQELGITDKDRIGSGGQGFVFKTALRFKELPFALVYKEYRPSILASLNVPILESMPQYLEGLGKAEALKVFKLCTWPSAIVKENGTTVGFLMPKISDDFFFEMKLPSSIKRVECQLQHLLNSEDFLAKRQIQLNNRKRYGIVKALAEGLGFLHAKGICVGDLSPKNLLVCIGNAPKVFFLDCDSMRFKGRSAAAQAETPDWEVQKANTGEELGTVKSDAYKLGLVALRLFAGDQQTRDVATLPKQVDAAVKVLITRALSANPASRPTPAEWIAALDSAAKSASFLSVVASPAPGAGVAPAAKSGAAAPAAKAGVATQPTASRPAWPPPPAPHVKRRDRVARFIRRHKRSAAALVAILVAAFLILPALSNCANMLTQWVSNMTVGSNGSKGQQASLTTSSDNSAQADASKLVNKVGDIVKFGDLSWRVLDIKDGRALLITEDIVELRAYNDTFTDVTWETCSLRAYLNGEFLDKHFSAAEQERIMLSEINNDDNPDYGTDGGNDTQDKLFLMSISGVENYFPSDADRVAKYQGSDFWWWLRSPGRNADRAASVSSNGSVYADGGDVGNDNGGVRPALWLNL
jgi:hypothetical protein